MAQNEQEFTDFELEVNVENLQAWDGEARPPLPIGEYKVKVTHVKHQLSKEKQTPMIAVTFEVIEGDQTGGKVFNNYNIGNDTGLGRLKQLMVACGTRLDKFVASEVLGAELMLNVDHEIVQGAPDANGNPGKERTYARISHERAIESKKATTSAPAQRPPVTNKAPATNGQTRRA